MNGRLDDGVEERKWIRWTEMEIGQVDALLDGSRGQESNVKT